METWKFLLYGVTGDLAKKKVLPALAQFAALNQTKVQVELIGYSRSQPKENEILKILNENSPENSHVLTDISYMQGDYGDGTAFFDIISHLKPQERLITYLAIPPELFVKILQNSCPFSKNEIDLIIEKPFGRSDQEASQMLNIIDACDLHGRVHFCDHYLFKTPAQLETSELNNLKHFETKTLKSILVQGLEDLDVKDRKGFYEGLGALEDFYIHLFSLLQGAIRYFYPQIEAGPDYEHFTVSSVQLGQYASYLGDMELENSTTNTYFNILGKLQMGNDQVEITLESGKMLDQKLTQVILHYTDGSSVLWRLAPKPILEIQSPEAQLSLNLQKNNKLDHTNLFERMLEREFSSFVDTGDILASREMLRNIYKFMANAKTPIEVYRDKRWPIEVVK